jgi:hypothetical protein
MCWQTRWPFADEFTVIFPVMVPKKHTASLGFQGCSW